MRGYLSIKFYEFYTIHYFLSTICTEGVTNSLFITWGAGRQDVDLYGLIVDQLSRYGTVLTPFVADKAISETSDAPQCTQPGQAGDVEIHDRHQDSI